MIANITNEPSRKSTGNTLYCNPWSPITLLYHSLEMINWLHDLRHNKCPYSTDRFNRPRFPLCQQPSCDSANIYSARLLMTTARAKGDGWKIQIKKTKTLIVFCLILALFWSDKIFPEGGAWTIRDLRQWHTNASCTYQQVSIYFTNKTIS